MVRFMRGQGQRLSLITKNLRQEAADDTGQEQQGEPRVDLGQTGALPSVRQLMKGNQRQSLMSFVVKHKE